jgi:predicted alpha/beta hydrolase
MHVSLSFLGLPVTLWPTALVSGTLSSLIVATFWRADRAALAAGAGALWYVADGAHVLGHVLSSQWSGAPLDAVDFGVYPQRVYRNNEVSPRQHIGRAVGGVAASLMLALALLALSCIFGPGWVRQLLTIAAAQNGLLFAISMLPLPIVDGGVMYTNLAHLRG